MPVIETETTTLIWLLVLLIILLAALTLVWSTVRTGMSPMPSSRAARAGILAALAYIDTDHHQGAIVDLGSGWGDLAIAVARRYPGRRVRGYELAWLPWLVSVVLARLLRLTNLTFVRGDYLLAVERGELNDMQTALTYLHGPGMVRLQAALEEQPGQLCWLISNNFAMPGWQPEQQWQLQDFYRSPLYLYSVKTVVRQRGSDCGTRPLN